MSRLDEYNDRRRLDHSRSKSKGRRDPVVHSLYAAARAEKIDGKCCRVCGRRDNIEAHHIVPRSKFGQRDTTVHSVDNLMALCHDHHQAHHTTTMRVSGHLLTAPEWDFLTSREHAGWVDLWYPT